MKERALEYLQRNSVMYMAMICPIRRNTADIIYAGQDGVFIKDSESGVYMLAVNNFDMGRKLVDEAGRQAHICVYQKGVADYIYEKHGHRKYVENLQAVYMKAEYVEINARILEIKPLALIHLDWVYQHYRDHLDYNYLKMRLEYGAIYGGYLNGELCGFAGTHTDGSMGIFKVLEKFRGRGFAVEIWSSMVNILLDSGEIPFSQIEYDNEASINLHKKLGFEISKATLYRLID